VEAQYHEKSHQQAINITKNIQAAKITIRLNLRIRLWYSATQPMPPAFIELDLIALVSIPVLRGCYSDTIFNAGAMLPRNKAPNT